MSNELYKCWMCKSDLKPGKKFKDQWVCVKCKDSYQKCKGCAAKGLVIFEWGENLKGSDCIECDHYFCISCVQNTGECVDSEDYEKPPGKDDRSWICDCCLK